MQNPTGITFVGSTPTPQPFKLNKTPSPDTLPASAPAANPVPTEQVTFTEQGGATPAVSLHDESETRSMREERPTTISIGAGFPTGIAIGVNHNLNDKFSVGGSVGTMGILNDYSVHGRYYFLGGKSASLYTETGAHLLQNNLHNTWGGPPFAGALTQTVGAEYRAKNGITLNAGVGGALSTAGKVAPAFSFGTGYSF